MPWRGAGPAAARGSRDLSAGWFLWQLLLQGSCLSAPVPAPAGDGLQGQCAASGDTKGHRKWPGLAGMELIFSEWLVQCFGFSESSVGDPDG